MWVVVCVVRWFGIGVWCGVWGVGFAVGACWLVFFFFFQAEDGIRDLIVTGVQTCALPIYRARLVVVPRAVVLLEEREIEAAERRRQLVTDPRIGPMADVAGQISDRRELLEEIGRASCRERV